ncbi:MAG: hypothetical protein ACI9XC_002053 [Gammaproteobacteria bacterium]|jgi:hypothetical protein
MMLNKYTIGIKLVDVCRIDLLELWLINYFYYMRKHIAECCVVIFIIDCRQNYGEIL